MSLWAKLLSTGSAVRMQAQWHCEHSTARILKLRIAWPVINCITCHARLRSLMWQRHPCHWHTRHTRSAVDWSKGQLLRVAAEFRESCGIDTRALLARSRDMRSSTTNSGKSTPFEKIRAIERNSSKLDRPDHAAKFDFSLKKRILFAVRSRYPYSSNSPIIIFNGTRRRPNCLSKRLNASNIERSIL